MLTVTTLLAALLPRAANGWADGALVGIVAIYLPVAMRRAYAGRWGTTVLRAAAVAAGYLVAATAAMAALLVGTFYLMGAAVS
jgi:hypothetical protein